MTTTRTGTATADTSRPLAIDQWGIDTDGNAYLQLDGGAPSTDHAVLSVNADGMPVLLGAASVDLLMADRERTRGRLIPPPPARPVTARIYPKRLRQAAPIPAPAFHRRDDGRLMIHPPVHAPRQHRRGGAHAA